MVRLDGSLEKVIYTTDSNADTTTNARTWPTLVIYCQPDAIARFDHQRGNLSREEYLEELLDLADGKLPY